MEKRYIVTIGVFDGVHLGHKVILQEVRKRAKVRKILSAVITFWPPPSKILNKNFLGWITDREDKKKLIQSLGIDYIWVLRVNQDFLKTKAEDFMRWIVRRIKIEELIVGEDFKFGYRGLGNIEKLKKFCLQFRFKLRVFKKKMVEGEVVSSSYIRRLIKKAEFKKAERLLGREYCLKGRVVKGRGVGKRLGYPTLNIDTNDFVLPPRGVYALKVFLNKRWFLGAANIGICPTFFNSKRSLSLEIYILNFDEEITDKKVKVIFLQRIRGERKFPSIEKLQEAIRRDIQYVSANFSLN